MAKKTRKRAHRRVEPSAALQERLEELVLDRLRTVGGRDFWTHLSSHIDNTLVRVRDPIDREWVDLSNYGKGKVLKGVLDGLEVRSVVSRKKNFHPYILTNVLDRIVKQMDRADEPPSGAATTR